MREDIDIKTRRTICNNIKSEVEQYLRYTNDFGNECAYTDSIIYNITQLAQQLKGEV